jgi:hypothetical protein
MSTLTQGLIEHQPYGFGYFKESSPVLGQSIVNYGALAQACGDTRPEHPAASFFVE